MKEELWIPLDEEGIFSKRVEGFSRIFSSRKDPNKLVEYVALDYGCGNMTKTLMHECLHLVSPDADEDYIRYYTNVYWNNLDIRKISQQRIVEELGNYNL